MGNFQYKIGAGGSWTDVPETAHPTDEGGSVVVVFPQAADRDGNGNPAGISYRKQVQITSPQMIVGSKGSGAAGQGTGWMWWQNFFASEDAVTAATFYITAFNPRTGAWEKWLGTLNRATFDSAEYMGTTMVYRSVKILVDDTTHTT